MTYENAVILIEGRLENAVKSLYGLDKCTLERISAHDGGRNLVYSVCGGKRGMLRVSYTEDRSSEDMLAEVEFVKYLHDGGAPVVDVFPSVNGRLLETINHCGHTLYIVLFEKAEGDSIAEHGYRYISGAPLEDYYYLCGKTLGRIHELAKSYKPVNRRYAYEEKYTPEFFDRMIPKNLPRLKDSFNAFMKRISQEAKSAETWGMLHYDYGDGNYSVDYSNGNITVYDFDNCCYGPYMYDVASLWRNGVGWKQFEKDAKVRKAFMDKYFAQTLRGYRSETALADEQLSHLQLYLEAVQMENIMDEFELASAAGKNPEIDESLAYQIKCAQDGIPFFGYFSDIYSPESPFEYNGKL